MSPEQTGRMNRAVDYRTRLLLAGRHVLRDADRPAALRGHRSAGVGPRHIARRPAAPGTSVRRGCPPALSAIVMKLLAKEARGPLPERRGRAQRPGAVPRAQWSRDGRIDAVPAGRAGRLRPVAAPAAAVRPRAEMAALAGRPSTACRRRAARAGAGVGLRPASASRRWCSELQRPIVRARAASSCPASSTSSSGRPLRHLRPGLPRAACAAILARAPSEHRRLARGACSEALGPNGQLIVERDPRAGADHRLRSRRSRRWRRSRPRTRFSLAVPRSSGVRDRRSTRWCCSSTTCSGRTWPA